MSNAAGLLTSRRWSHRLTIGVFALVALTTVAYSPALRGPPLFDDRFAIADNPTITQLWPPWRALHPPAQTPVSGRPLVNLSFAVNYWLNDRLGIDQQQDAGATDQTLGYHVVNLMLHLACGLLLLGIIRRTLRSGRLGEAWATRADAVAWITAAIWLLHPIQTDAVDYLVQRTEVLASCCYLGTVYASIRAWDAVTTRARIRWYVASAIACLLGMASKEIVATAPLIVVLYDRAFRVESWRVMTARPYRARRWFYGALAATWLLLAILLLGAPRSHSVGFHAGMPWYAYLHTQGWAILHYLRLVLVPAGLTLDYGYQPIADWQGVPGLLVLAALAVLTLIGWTRAGRWGWAAFLGSWFFLILAPSSSVIPIISEIAAERRMYLPVAAVLLFGVLAGATLLRRVSTRHRRADGMFAGVTAVVIGCLTVATFARSRMYQDPAAMWRDSIMHQPGNARAWFNLGAVLSVDPDVPRTTVDSLYRAAVQRDSSYVDALLHVVIDDLSQGRRTEAGQLLQRVPLEFGNDTAMAGLGSTLLARGDTAGALLVFERATTGSPNAELLADLATLYLATGQEAQAANALGRSVRADPARTDRTALLGAMLLQLGHPVEAIPYLERVVERQPAAAALAMLSLAYADAGRSGDAVGPAARAVAMAGTNARVDFFAGRAMLDGHRPDLAQAYLTRAVALAPAAADAVAALADADSVLGRPAEAAALRQRARLLRRDNAPAQP